MRTTTKATALDSPEFDDLFDLDVQIEVTNTVGEVGFTSWGCSLSCSCFQPTLCC
ncbi:FDLD family class I lanthipeptide [Streptomyces sp. NPDC020719]|uniref:FDLD family class I lanthipeptide n=1 Tax=unclassified Streptomyces TaxID=2593676 RepID=UPI00340F7892